MKKLIALAMVLAMLLGLCACGKDEERYPKIADMLDRGDYEGAIEEIREMYEDSLEEENRDNGEDEEETEETEDTLPEYPSDEDWEQLHQYSNIYSSLRNYAGGNSYISMHDSANSVWYEGNDAVRYCYETLPKLTGIDKWIGTEHLEIWGDDINWDREALISGFSVMEDMLLTSKAWYEDALGNINDSSTYRYVYNKDGSSASFQDINYTFSAGPSYPYDYGTPEYTYNDAGQLTRLRLLDYEDQVNCIIDYTYNPDGTLATETYQDRNSKAYSITYVYDSGRLVQAVGMPPITYYMNNPATVEYTYNDAGQLVREYHVEQDVGDSSWLYDYLIEYIYDDAGNLSAIHAAVVYRSRDWDTKEFKISDYRNVTVYTYAYDDAGHMVRSTYANMGSFDAEGNRTSTEVYRTYITDYTYGTYYFFDMPQ